MFLENTLRNFFGKKQIFGDVVFCGNSMNASLNATTNVRITLCTFGYADHYSGLLVEVFGKSSGLVISQSFRFVDIIGEIPCRDGNTSPYIWNSGKSEFSWCGSEPNARQKNAIAQRVCDFLKLYQ